MMTKLISVDPDIAIDPIVCYRFWGATLSIVLHLVTEFIDSRPNGATGVWSVDLKCIRSTSGEWMAMVFEA